jgi:hypothetical protein
MADGESAQDSAVHAAIDEALTAGPLSLADLTGRLASLGLLGDIVDADAQVDEVLWALENHPMVWVTAGDRVGLLEPALDGAVFTHRLRADEIDHRMIDATPDFEPLDFDREAPLTSSGKPVERVFDHDDPHAAEEGSLVGPEGWLDGFRAGELVALRRSGGEVTVERADDVSDGDVAAAALRRAFDARVDRAGVGDLIAAVALDALVEDPTLFRSPLPPLGDLLAMAGLSCQREWTGPADVEWVPGFVAAHEDELDVLAERYLLDDCCVELLVAALDVWNEYVLAPDAEHPWRDVGRALAHGWVAAAFADYLLGVRTEPRPQLDGFAVALSSQPERTAKAVAAYLLARNLERSDDVLAAEAALEGAVRHDPAYEPALEDLAWHAADRGDADRALNLLRRAGAEQDDPQVELLEAMRPVRNAAGRNERCPCGSGRKYKDCCQRSGRRPLADRVDWLQHKLWSFTLRPHRQHVALSLTAVLAGSMDDDDLDDVLESGLSMDLAAFEAELAGAFLRERGPLLPEDERAVLATWLEQPRVLWEVVEPVGAAAVVRRIDTGELATVKGLAEGRAGDVFLVRVAPFADHAIAVGVPILVPAEVLPSAEALVAARPDPWQIAGWWAGVAPSPPATPAAT